MVVAVIDLGHRQLNPGGNKVEKKEEKCHFCGKKGH